MALVDRADLARSQGGRYLPLVKEAFAQESLAAQMMAECVDEPDRSVLHRSAASLALECFEYEGAARLVSSGLAGDPPEEIAEELKEILRQIPVRKALNSAVSSLTK